MKSERQGQTIILGKFKMKNVKRVKATIDILFLLIAIQKSFTESYVALISVLLCAVFFTHRTETVQQTLMYLIVVTTLRHSFNIQISRFSI